MANIAPRNSIPYEVISQIAREEGLYLFGALTSEELNLLLSSEKSRLKDWQDKGYGAKMDYMKRNPDLFCSLENFLPGVKSVLTFIVPYAEPREPDVECSIGFGKVARYARGLDYHTVLKDLVSNVGRKVADQCGLGDSSYRVFSDAVPLLERAIATAGGLGFIGKSAMMIQPKIGTYTFIAELLLTFEVTDLPQRKEYKSSCGTCQKCLSNCPTNAFVSPYVVDAAKCISYLTIEKRDSHTIEESIAIGNWIFGCDVCQEVCPFNKHGNKISVRDEFHSDKGVGAFLELAPLLKLRKQNDFKTRFKDSAILRAKREGLLRNALSVIANQNFSSAYKEVINCFKQDPSTLIREQAKFTLERLLKVESGIVGREIESSLESQRS